MTPSTKPAAEPAKDTAQDWASLKDLILRLLPPMASLAAVSLAGVSLFHLIDKLNAGQTALDELLTICAVILLLCYPVTIWAVHTRHMRRAFFLGRLTLTMFLSAVMLLVYVVFGFLFGLSK